MDFNKELSHYIDVLTKVCEGTPIDTNSYKEINKLIGRMEGVKESLPEQK